MKVHITATSGVGKSTVIQVLADKGYDAYDADEVPGLSQLVIRKTGEPIEWPKGYIDWSQYSWDLQKDVLEELLDTDEDVFIGGINGNQREFYKNFGKLIVLTIDPSEHERRLRARPKRDVGDDERNIQEKLRKYPIKLQQFLDDGYIPVDSSGPVSETVKEILRVAHED